jgi:hypothetical protein
MQCYRCDEPAVQECRRCGHVYCDDHGDLLCSQCADPSSALAGYRVYRGTMLALLIGAVVLLWLILNASQELDGGPRLTGAPASSSAVLTGPTSDDRPREGGLLP